jgi:predicted negative regulator of RcsB-dependent stress response
MATHLDLEEQEQLDEIKHFWKQYGNVITWILIATLAGFAAWNGYQFWQKNQASQAAAMLDEVEKAIRVGDNLKIERAFGDMKERFSSTAYAHQAGLLVGKALFESGQLEGAKSALNWVSEKSADSGYASVAKLRLASLLVEGKNLDEALKTLSVPIALEFDALVADRRGDIFMAQGNKSEAKAEYLKAYKKFDEKAEYRRLVEVKLNALGVSPTGESN